MTKGYYEVLLLLAMAVCAGEQILPQTPKSGSHKPVKPLAVSSDFKRVMTAAVDPTSTVADVRAYIRDARIQIRTTQDSLLFAKLLLATDLSEKARKDAETIDEDLADLARGRAAYARRMRTSSRSPACLRKAPGCRRLSGTLRQSKAWELTDSAARLERFGT
jgi:hypothetical protein